MAENQKSLEVGDILKVETFMGVSLFPITRVTKTKALSTFDGYEHSFQREISSNMSYPYEYRECTKYTVTRKSFGRVK